MSRSAATVAVIIALLAGSAWGNDEHFPFGPFRMYSTRSDPNATISVIRLEGVTIHGRRVELSTNRFGLRPAEVVGELARFTDNSRLTAYLAEAYENFRREPPLRELRLIRGYHRLRGGYPVAYFEETVGVWRRPR